MRKFLLFVTLCISGSAIAGVPKSMVVYTETGAKSHSFANIRKLTFGAVQENSMEVHLRNGNTVIYPYSQMQKAVFSENSGVEDVNIESSVVKVIYDSFSEELSITSTEPIKRVQVYDMRGLTAVSHVIVENESSLSLSSLSSGIYVVKVETESTVTTEKIVKR